MGDTAGIGRPLAPRYVAADGLASNRPMAWWAAEEVRLSRSPFVCGRELVVNATRRAESWVSSVRSPRGRTG